MSKYTYKYTPNGKNAEKITNWLKAQPNKAESLNLLILRAERQYGNQDIVDMTTQVFLNDEIKKPTNKPEKSPTTMNTDGDDEELTNPKSTATTSVPEPTSETEPTNDHKEKPNIKFLTGKN